MARNKQAIPSHSLPQTNRPSVLCYAKYSNRQGLMTCRRSRARAVGELVLAANCTWGSEEERQPAPRSLPGKARTLLLPGSGLGTQIATPARQPKTHHNKVWVPFSLLWDLHLAGRAKRHRGMFATLFSATRTSSKSGPPLCV